MARTDREQRSRTNDDRDSGSRGSDNGASGGSGGNNGTNGAVTMDQVRSMIEREGRGSAHRAIMKLMTDANKARNRARNAEQRVKELEANPDAVHLDDGEIILSPEDAKTWEAVKALGKKPEELKAALDENAKLKADAKRAEDDKYVVEFAHEVGWSDKLLTELLRDKGYDISLRDTTVVTEDNKRETKKLLHVRKTGGDDKTPWELCETVVERDLANYLPALELAPDEDEMGYGGEEGDEEEEGELVEAGTAPRRRRQPGGYGNGSAYADGTRNASRGRERATRGRVIDSAEVPFPPQGGAGRTRRSSTSAKDLQEQLKAKAANGEYVL